LAYITVPADLRKGHAMVTAVLIGGAGLYLCLKYGFLNRPRSELITTTLVVGAPIFLSFWLLNLCLDTNIETMAVILVITAALPILTSYCPATLTVLSMAASSAIFFNLGHIIESALALALSLILLVWWLLKDGRRNLKAYAQ